MISLKVNTNLLKSNMVALIGGWFTRGHLSGKFICSEVVLFGYLTIKY